MKVPTYDQRVAKMHKPGDEEEQIRRAKAYMMRLRRRKKTASTLAEKIEIEKAEKSAESVLRQLRLNVFELEDMLRAKEATTVKSIECRL